MPKSRGRPPRRRKPGTSGGSAASWQAHYVSQARHLLAPDTSRTLAQLFASSILGEINEGRSIHDADPSTGAVASLTAYASRRATSFAAALVAALATIRDDECLTEAMQSWAAPLLTDVPWVTAPPATLTAAHTITDEYDDMRVWLLDYDDGVLVVHTERNMDNAVTALSLLRPGAREAYVQKHPFGSDVDCVEAPLDETIRTLRRAQQLTERWWPPYDDEDYVPYTALLAARLRAADVAEVPLPGVDWEPMPDSDRTALLDRFFADVELPDDDVTRELADLCVRYGDGWVDGGALMWSPAIVERYLLDWVPRKTFLDEERRRLLPLVTYAFVGWALVQRGLDKGVAEDAAATALDLADDFAEMYDETERSPATDLARYLQENDVDVDDALAVERAVSAFNAERNARRLLD